MVNIHDANPEVTTMAAKTPTLVTLPVSHSVPQEQFPTSFDSEDSPSSAPSVKIIRISRKRPIGFYIRISKEFLNTHDEVVLSGLGLAMSTAVFVADILKKSGHAVVSRVETSTITKNSEEDDEGSPMAPMKPAEETKFTPSRSKKKARIQIFIMKSQKIDAVIPCLAADHIVNQGIKVNGNGNGNSNNHLIKDATDVYNTTTSPAKAEFINSAPVAPTTPITQEI